jgi:LacI family transcriptional regulator
MSEEPPDHPPLSIKSIARRAGVSPMTVSLALRNRRGVSAATRERIQAMAREMGYRQDPVVAQLMSRLKRSRRIAPATIAFVTDHERPFSQMGETLDTSCFLGARDRLHQLGYDLEEFVLGRGMTAGRLGKVLWSRGVEGILVGPLKAGRTKLDLPWEKFTAVAIGHSLAEPKLNRVSNDQFRSICVAMETLHHLGYRRIGVFTGQAANERVNEAWRAGHMFACERLGIERIRKGIRDAQPSFESFRAWLSKARPDVVLAGTAKRNVASWLAALSVKVPRDVGYALLHRCPGDGPCAGIDQNWEGIGRTAAELLVSQINAQTHGVPDSPFVLNIEGRWVGGRSVRRRRVATAG